MLQLVLDLEREQHLEALLDAADDVELPHPVEGAEAQHLDTHPSHRHEGHVWNMMSWSHDNVMICTADWQMSVDTVWKVSQEHCLKSVKSAKRKGHKLIDDSNELYFTDRNYY